MFRSALRHVWLFDIPTWLVFLFFKGSKKPKNKISFCHHYNYRVLFYSQVNLGTRHTSTYHTDQSKKFCRTYRGGHRKIVVYSKRSRRKRPCCFPKSRDGSWKAKCFTSLRATTSLCEALRSSVSIVTTHS